MVVNPVRVNEAFGRVPFEAAIAGRPAVVTRVGAVPELLRDGESALIVAPDDPAAIAAERSGCSTTRELAARPRRRRPEVVADRLTPEQSLVRVPGAVAATLARAAPR